MGKVDEEDGDLVFSSLAAFPDVYRGSGFIGLTCAGCLRVSRWVASRAANLPGSLAGAPKPPRIGLGKPDA
jgi:hypothetical protein